MRKYNCIDYTELGKRISNRRKELKLTQKELAEKLDCNDSYISKLEKGKTKPTLDFIFLIAKTFEVGVDYLIPFTSENSKIMKEEFQERWEKCSPEMIKFLNNIIDAVEQFEQDMIAKHSIY